MAAILVPPLLFIPAGLAFAAPFAPPKPQQVPSVAVRDVPKVKASPRQAELDRVMSPASATLPGPSVTELEIGVAAKGPFTLSDSGAEFQKTRIRRVLLEVLDRSATSKTRQTGVVMRVKRSDGGTANGLAGVTVNYSSFAHAYGGDWGTRLKLFRLPECALSTPEHVDCQPIALPSSNNVKTGTVSADVPVSSMGTLVAAAAAPSGSSGTYKATDLSPSATWQAGGSTGGFTWSYGIGTPPVPGGLAPTLGVAYSSSSVDGRTVSTNSQPTWAGEGFSLWPGFIERRYKACADDGHPTSGEQCWETHNATLSLNGSGGELLKDAAGRWHARTDDGSRIELKTGAANGVHDGEHWVVTTTDGTQYYFGLAPTAAWTVPVVGNETNEPCHGATFAASFCEQAWRWNLDKVVDRNSNVMMFFYGEEKNRYARNQDGSNTVEYVRGGWLERIEYGLRVGSSTPAPGQVVFTPADRCFTAGACDQAVEANRKNWQDSPLDQSCSSTSSCPGLFAPTFWTGKRLSKIVTQIRSGATYRDVDSWVLNHTFRKPSDTTSGVLWLDSIVRTGHTNGNIAMAPVRFDGVAMPNRADSLVDNAPTMNRFRVTNIFTETGGEISIAYSGQDCVPGTRMPAAEDNNSLRCMPVRWQPAGYASPILDWFHTYVVETVSEHDRTAGALSAQHTFTRYEYLGTPAWHADDDDLLVEPKNKSWAQFRGYGEVRVHKGDPGEEQVTSTRFFRGMHGDKLKNGSTRSVQVDGVNDVDHFAGMARESVTYNGAAKVSSTVMDPWRSNPTATRTINGSTVEARFTGTSKQRTETVLDNNRPSRFATVHTGYDEYGMVKEVNDEGQEGLAGDEQCTKTSYVRDTAEWLIAFPSAVEIVAKPCGSAAANENEVVSFTRTFYDELAFNTKPVKGNVTRREVISAWAANGNHSWVPTVQDTYDGYGRVTKSTDALGYAVNSTYTHNVDGLLSATSIRNALFHTTTTQVDVARGLATSETDANSKTTQLEYDALGRLTNVWRPGRSKTQTPNFAFEYHLFNDAPSAVVTKLLNPAGGQIVSFEIFDGLLRSRQTQNRSPSVQGGRIMSDVFYDTAGRKVRTYEHYHAAGDPSRILASVVNVGDVERQQVTKYDGAGRVMESVFQPKNTPKWTTATGYGGDRTYLTPPEGGTAKTTIVDVTGRVTELRQHHQRDTSSTYDATTYTYSQRGDLAAVRDPNGNIWRSTVDIRGRVISTSDPDEGVSTAGYDDLNRRTSSTDARGVKMVTAYDKIGRKVSLSQDIGGVLTKHAEWKYDTSTTNGKGRLASVIRHMGTSAYSTTISGYSDAGLATGAKVSIPAGEGALTGEYEFTTTHNVDGSVASRYMPGLAGELSETLQFGYDSLGNATTLQGNLPDTPRYVAATKYGEYGQVLQVDLSSKDSNGFVYRSFTYETDTGRVATSTTSRDSVSPNYVAITSYGYDADGNVKSIAESQTGDTQCIRYDHLRRMEKAWTPATGGCAADPSTSNLGGPAPYWHSYTFDVLGNRHTETRHATAGDTVATYAYAGTRPHALTSVSTAMPGSPDRVDTFGYNEIGSTNSRTVNGVTQTVEWDPEGHASKVGGSTYIYDGDGHRLLAKDSTGTTLYLPFGVELRLNKSTGAVSSTKYYSFGKMTIAVRKGGKLTWLTNDHHDTGELSISDGTQALIRRHSLPYGGTRGSAQPGWPTDKGFVGGTKDETGLTHLGARLYDPLLGRFLSVDPVIDNMDPQQMNGYAYSNNAPATFSDADGQFLGKVFKFAGAVVNHQINTVKWMANKAYEHAGTISAVTGMLALVPCLAPVFGPISLGFAVLDAYKNCSEGHSVDCAIGIVSIIPGGRIAGGAIRGAYKAHRAKKGVDAAEEAVAKAQRKLDSFPDGKRDPLINRRRNRAQERLDDANAKADTANANRRQWQGRDFGGWEVADGVSTWVGASLEGGKQASPLYTDGGFATYNQHFRAPNLWTGSAYNDPTRSNDFGGRFNISGNSKSFTLFPAAGYFTGGNWYVPSPPPSAAAQAATNRMYAQKHAYMDKHYG